MTLIRRLTYDLTGLPPTPEEVDAFVADHAHDAYERLVDRLLDSPHYGEKWGRHWLDLVRYAETNGYERDSAKPFAWRYRDYVIDAFNHDKPYDQFIREQLAGDEIDPELGRRADRHRLLSPGHLGRRAGRPAAGPLRRARRHHLHDRPGLPGDDDQLRPLPRSQGRPDPQKDYYRLLAFFQDIVDPNGKNLKKVADRRARGSRSCASPSGAVARRTSCCAAIRTCRVKRSSPACPRS